MGIPLDWNRRLPPHPSDEILEEYALGRLPEERVVIVEEHLLICESCRDAIAETDRFVAALKSATRHKAPWWSAVPSHARSLAPILVLFLLALAVVWKRPPETAAPFVVNLSSLRGSSPPAPTPAGQPLRLTIDQPDLTPTNEYSVDVVDASGSSVWKGVVSDVDGKLVTTLPRPLVRGVYWVRLYGSNSELLREFGLSAK